MNNAGKVTRSIIKTPISFLTVSLLENSELIRKSVIFQSHKFADISYYIICPQNEVRDFQNVFADLDCCKIISEDDLFCFTDFSSEWRNNKFFSNLVSERSLKWYYQQVLKLEFIMKFRFSGKHLILWDADTIPIRQIRFFKGPVPLQYGSPYEFEDIYRAVNSYIFADQLKASSSKYSYVTQFCTVTQPMQEMLEVLIMTSPIYNPLFSSAVNLTNIIIDGVYNIGSTLNTPSFSEYELLGVICESIYSGKQAKLKFLRWELQGLLNNSQLLLLHILGYVHITYENIQVQKDYHMTPLQFLVALRSNLRASLK
jgi:hypothetical protein